jgi:FkbM family methyltransferase
MEKFKIGLYTSLKKDPLNAFISNELNYALFPNDDLVSISIMQGWQYHPYMFEFLSKNQIITEGKTIIDIGGNNGSFAIDFAHLVGNGGVVHTFEPQRIIYYQLCANLFLNGLTNVYCHNLAIAETSKLAMIQTPDYLENSLHVNYGGAEIVSQGGEEVQCRPLDYFDFKDVVLIKIDVQGYESYVIQGAINTIQQHRPYLFVEFEDHLLKKQGTSEDELKAKIEALGYLVLPFQEGIPYQSYSGKCLDCVAIPKEKFEEFKHIIP